MEYYLVLKSNKLSMTRMDYENTGVSQRSHSQNTIWPHVCECLKQTNP